MTSDHRLFTFTFTGFTGLRLAELRQITALTIYKHFLQVAAASKSICYHLFRLV